MTNAETSYSGQPINFGIGMPNPELLPTELLRQSALEGISSDYLNYTESLGNSAFREILASFLQSVNGAPVEPESLLVTAGALSLINDVCANFTQPGDVVFVEEPTFYLMLSLFKDHGLQIVPIPVDDDGLDIDYLEQQLKLFTPAFVYTIPVYHNPTSVSLSAERKERLVALSEQHDFLIVADEVYQLLHYEASPPPSFVTYLATDRVFVVGSFSKIVAPGLRLGWVQTSPPLMKRLVGKGLVAINGGFSHFTSGIVANLIQSGQQRSIIHTLRTTFAARVDVLDAALREHMPERVSFRKPAGGYFFWLELPQHSNGAQLLEQARAFGVGFQPGSYSSSRDELQNFIRLSFGYYDEPALIEGARRLGKLLKEAT